LQHTFPEDYRSDPTKSAWDPSKRVIIELAKLGVVWGLQYANAEDIAAARAYMLALGRDDRGAYDKAVDEEEWVGPTWRMHRLNAVDVTGYIDTHVRLSLFPHIWDLLTFVAWLPILARVASGGRRTGRSMEA
jgi:hypothetical protein